MHDAPTAEPFTRTFFLHAQQVGGKGKAEIVASRDGGRAVCCCGRRGKSERGVRMTCDEFVTWDRNVKL